MSNFSGMPGFPIGSSKKLKPEVDKLRKSVQNGAMERRKKLFEKLSGLAEAYGAECQFAAALQTVEEMLELVETLAEEGQFEMRGELALSLSQMITYARTSALQNGKHFDQTPFFKHYSKVIESLSEDEFDKIKNEWALDVHQYAEDLHEKNNVTVAAISLLDHTIQVMEPRLDPQSLNFTDWRPLLDAYRSRSIWKFEIGDRESALADMLRYEELAEKAHERQQVHRKNIKSRSSYEGDKLIIRLDSEDWVNHAAAYDFEDKRYDAILQLADMFAGRAEKNNALRYYDKALAIAQEIRGGKYKNNLALFAAPVEIPFRKGFMLLQYREYEATLREFDVAVREVEKLLQTDQKQHFADLESRLGELARYRSDALRNLGRFEEAEKAIDEMKQLFAKAVSTISVSKAAQAERLEKNPLASLFKKPEPAKKKPSTEKDIEQQAMMQFGAKHNEAIADMQRGQMEMHRGYWKAALKYFLKARFVLDSPVLHEFYETRANLYGVYVSIGRSYLAVGKYDLSEKWYRRGMESAQKLLGEGRLEYGPMYCAAVEGLAYLFSVQERHEEALREFENTFNGRSAWIDEALEGLDIERLRTRDNQRLMPAAKMLQSQNQTMQFIEKELCALDRIDEAITWGKRALDVFDRFRSLLLQPEQSDYDQFVTAISYAALLLMGKRHAEADEFIETQSKKMLESDHIPAEVQTKTQIDLLIARRLYELLETGEFRNVKRIINEANKSAFRTKDGEASLLYESAGELLRKHQQAAQNEHRLIQYFWAEMIKANDHCILQSKTDPSKWAEANSKNGLFDSTEESEDDADIEPESEELDKELADYEARDFDDFSENQDTLYNMLDEFTGGTTASDMMRKYHRGEVGMEDIAGKPIRKTGPKVGRNDPCPCGSGKKYKKCCMDNETELYS